MSRTATTPRNPRAAGAPRALLGARHRALVVLIGALLIASCGSESEPDVAMSATVPVSTTAEASPAQPSPGPTATAASATPCEQLAADAAQGQGDSSFVEAGGAQYVVQSSRELPEGRVIVDTAVDQPALVGYSQVLFLSHCGDGEVILLGAYVPTDGSLQLLFTTLEAPEYGDVPVLAP